MDKNTACFLSTMVILKVHLRTPGDCSSSDYFLGKINFGEKWEIHQQEGMVHPCPAKLFWSLGIAGGKTGL